MEPSREEKLQAHLMATDDEFRRLASEHSDYALKLQELGARQRLTAEEQLEEVRLKKLKLRSKDAMQRILQSSAREVA